MCAMIHKKSLTREFPKPAGRRIPRRDVRYFGSESPIRGWVRPSGANGQEKSFWLNPLAETNILPPSGPSVQSRRKLDRQFCDFPSEKSARKIIRLGKRDISPAIEESHTKKMLEYNADAAVKMLLHFRNDPDAHKWAEAEKILVTHFHRLAAQHMMSTLFLPAEPGRSRLLELARKLPIESKWDYFLHAIMETSRNGKHGASREEIRKICDALVGILCSSKTTKSFEKIGFSAVVNMKAYDFPAEYTRRLLARFGVSEDAYWQLMTCFGGKHGNDAMGILKSTRVNENLITQAFQMIADEMGMCGLRQEGMARSGKKNKEEINRAERLDMLFDLLRHYAETKQCNGRISECCKMAGIEIQNQGQ